MQYELDHTKECQAGKGHWSNDHMYEKIRKANNIMGPIRSFIHLDEDMFLKLFCILNTSLLYSICA